MKVETKFEVGDHIKVRTAKGLVDDIIVGTQIKIFIKHIVIAYILKNHDDLVTENCITK